MIQGRFLASVLVALSLAGAARAGTPPVSASQAARRTPVVDVFERTRDAVVNIKATQVFERSMPSLFDEFFGTPNRPRTRRYEATSLGSGFVIHPDGYIVTNAHVLMRAAAQEVIFADGSKFEAEQVAIDEQHDLAVLRIKAKQPLPAITLGRSDDIMVGETVIAIGNPLGYQHTVTTGIVSALHRKLEFDEGGTYEDLIQTDASINRGNSGGPLLNVLGELIGINTAIRGDAQNIGFAIPVDALRKLLPEMLSIERKPKGMLIGLRLSWKGRPVVVEASGPAAAAGVEPGDEVISVDGKPIKHDLDLYIHLLRVRPQDHITVELKRSGKPVKASIQPKPVPIPDGAKLLREKFGLSVRLLGEEQAKRLRAMPGLVITAIEPGSPAARAGMQREMVIYQVGQFFPNDLDELGLLLDKVKAGDKVTFQLYRIEGDYLQAYSAGLVAR